jgi:hypothetical protein
MTGTWVVVPRKWLKLSFWNLCSFCPFEIFLLFIILQTESRLMFQGRIKIIFLNTEIVIFQK